MKPEAQRIAIATALGFTRIRAIPIVVGGEEWASNTYGEKEGRESLVPDYLNDLNAMHEMEKVLTDEQYIEFGMCLEAIAVRSGLNTWRARSATAAQRCEAFLRTIGKWTDSAPLAATAEGEKRESP